MSADEMGDKTEFLEVAIGGREFLIDIGGIRRNEAAYIARHAADLDPAAIASLDPDLRLALLGVLAAFDMANTPKPIDAGVDPRTPIVVLSRGY